MVKKPTSDTSCLAKRCILCYSEASQVTIFPPMVL